MSTSSIKRFTLTRRVVASSGIAAALFVAGPVAVAAADDEASATPSDSSTIGEVSTEAVDTEDSGTSDYESSPDGVDPSTDVTATDDDTTPAGAEAEPESPSDTPVTPEFAPAESPAPDEPADSTGSPWFSNAPHHDAASDDTAEDTTDEAPSDNISAEPVDTDTHAPLRDPLVDHTTPPAFEITVDAGEATAASDPVITAAAPIVEVDDEGSIFYQLTHGTGTEGLILFNQSAMMLGVLSRRGRGNGQDYAALLGPGESGFLPARVITEGSLAKHAWDDEAGILSLSSSTVQRFFDRSLVALSSTDEVDPDNRFLDPSDSDWAGGWAEDVDATPPPGTSYSVGEDGSVTIHNDSDVDIAVISPYHGVWSEQGLAVIRPGQSHTIDETATNPLGFNAYWVQAERQDGRGVIIAQVMTAGGQVLVAPATEGYPDQSRWLPLQGTTPLDVDDLDPGDRFLDPSDDLATGGSDFELSYGNPETAGVNYSVVDDDHIRVHNDGTGTIAVTQSTPGGQLLGFDVLAPGESKVYGTVPGGLAVVSVQAERGADGKPVLLGGVMSSPVGGTIIGTPPYDGYPAIPLRDAPLPENHAPTGEVVALPKPADQRERVYTVSGFDFDGDALTFSVHTPPTRGTLVDNGDGTFTYTPTDPNDLHEGFVDDQFLIQISDGHGGTGLAPGFVSYGFDNINELPVIESVTGRLDDIGRGEWLLVVTDPDGDTIGISDFDRPTYGELRVEQVFEAGPIHGSPVPVPGTYTVVYLPDLVRAHESAYDDQFTVTFSDGHGGTVTETINVHVPYYNQPPVVHLYAPSGTVESGTGRYAVDVTDRDGDTVTIVSATSQLGGTVTIVDGVLYYTPNPDVEYDYYADTITVIGDDGHGGTHTTETVVRVMDTTDVIWVDDGRGEILVFTAYSISYPDSPLERHGRLVVNYHYDYEQSLAFVDELEDSSVAEHFGDYRQMLQDYEDALNAPEPEPEGPDWGEPGQWIPGDGEYELPGYDADDEPVSIGDADNFLLELLGSLDFVRNLGEVWATMLAYDDFEDFADKLSDQLGKLETVSNDAPILKHSKYVFKSIGPIGTLLSLGIATAQLTDADTPNEELHAQIELLSAATPAVFAATGAVLLGVVGGPAAALVGLNIGAVVGTALGLGLSIGAEISLNDDFRDAFEGVLEQPAKADDWWPL
ncbi:Ig-like domain-containing protein [Gordonia sp. NPDC058843]|uniref:Ig-like domain-containing protein n=1 Tax=Gordonia sp. NPDC058843 TaxID=3346648 RepID=UPI0036CB827A